MSVENCDRLLEGNGFPFRAVPIATYSNSDIAANPMVYVHGEVCELPIDIDSAFDLAHWGVRTDLSARDLTMDKSYRKKGSDFRSFLFTVNSERSTTENNACFVDAFNGTNIQVATIHVGDGHNDYRSKPFIENSPSRSNPYLWWHVSDDEVVLSALLPDLSVHSGNGRPRGQKRRPTAQGGYPVSDVFLTPFAHCREHSEHGRDGSRLSQECVDKHSSARRSSDRQPAFPVHVHFSSPQPLHLIAMVDGMQLPEVAE